MATSAPVDTEDTPGAATPAPFAATVWADLQGIAELKGTRLQALSGFLDVLLLPGTLSVLLFRLSCLCHESGLRPISRLLYILNVVLFGADLAPGAQVGAGLVVPHPVSVGVAHQVKLGRNVRLLHQAALGGGAFEDQARDGFPTVGDGCWIFTGAKVLGPIHVGAHAMIGPNSVVMRSVPPGAIVLGNPARVIGYRDGFHPPKGRTATRHAVETPSTDGPEGESRLPAADGPVGGVAVGEGGA